MGVAEPRWTPDYGESLEWPPGCPHCGGRASLPEFAPCLDCGKKAVRHYWCPGEEREYRSEMHRCDGRPWYEVPAWSQEWRQPD